MSVKNRATDQLKDKINENPIQHLDLLFNLLPENYVQAETILQLMDELVKEKNLDRHLLYKRMEEPFYFQDQSGQDFVRREPLVAKLVREGGLNCLNHYLYFKYGSPLSAELLTLHDIFTFNLPPVKNYIDKNNWLAFVENDEKARIIKKYYSVFGMTYELFGDVIQEKNRSILKRLVECKYDFNKPSHIEHLKKYLYINRDDYLQIRDETVEFLLRHGLNPNSYLNLFLIVFWDQLLLTPIPLMHYSLIHLINYLLDHNANFTHFSQEFLEKFAHAFAGYAEKIISLQPAEQQRIVEEVWCLQGHLIEAVVSFEKAKPYYLKAGAKGTRLMQRKQLVILLETVKNLSKSTH